MNKYPNKSCYSQIDDADLGLGVVLFDNIFEPSQAWARRALPDAKMIRITGPEQLSKSVIWWSNLPTEFFLQNHTWSQYCWIKSDYYPFIKLDDALIEWGFAPMCSAIPSTPPQICQFLCEIFKRIMYLALRLMHNCKSDVLVSEIFKSTNLADDLRPLLVQQYNTEHGHQSRSKAFRFPQFEIFPYKSFTNQAQLLTLRKPSFSYLSTMFHAPMLELGKLIDHPTKETNVQSILTELKQFNHSDLCTFTRVKIFNLNDDAGIRTRYYFSRKSIYSKFHIWVSLAELHFLLKFAKIKIFCSQICHKRRTFNSIFSAPVVDFINNKEFESSWTAGILTKALWFTLFRHCEFLVKSSKLQSQLNRINLNRINKLAMLSATENFLRRGFAVAGTGFGELIIHTTIQQTVDAILTGFETGLIPPMVAVPTDAFKELDQASWAGSPGSFPLVRSTMTKDRNMARELDLLPLINSKPRAN